MIFVILAWNSTHELQNYENFIISLQKHKKNEIHRIPRQNNENNENLNIPQQITKIMKFLEFHYRIK